MAFKTLYHRSSVLYLTFSLKPNRLFSRVYGSVSYTVNYKMNTLYLHNEQGDEKVHINFSFSHDVLSMNKVMCFNRRLTETIGSFSEKLSSRIEMLYLKKANKKAKKNKVEESEITCPALNTTFLLNDEPLCKETALEDILKSNDNENLKVRILNNDYEVVVNAPTVTKLTLPPVLRVGSPVFPLDFETKCVDIENSVFTWFKSRENNKFWEECGEGYAYTPTEEDFGNYLRLRCVAGNKIKTGLTYEIISESKVADFLGSAEIEKRHNFTRQKTNGDEIRIVSYNILAENYLNTKEGKTILFRYCDPKILESNYRRDLLNFELLGYKADLLCIQEADRKLFGTNLNHVFKNKGYVSFYHEKEGQKEGCGLFCDLSKFDPLQEESFVLNEEILNNPLLKDFKEEIEKNKKLLERLHNIATLLQVVVLQCKTSPMNIIVVGNTHLYFHPDADHIRLLQGLTVFRLLLGVIDKFKEKSPDKNVSLLLCGDFNSTPECGFHQFLNEGAIDGSHIDWKSKEDEQIENISCTHSLKLKSACGTPQFTNYTEVFKACLDYIYIQTDHLEVKQVVPFPSEEALSHQTAIPNEYFPSDHVALVADLKFKS